MRQTLLNSFRTALHGIARTLLSQRNMKIHVLIALLVIFFGMSVPLDLATRAALIFCIALVFLAEILNTALEAIVDLYIGEFHRLAMVAKDAAAGGVLVLSVAAFFIFVDICVISFPVMLQNVDNILFFMGFGAILVALESIGFWWIKARWFTLIHTLLVLVLFAFIWQYAFDFIFWILGLLIAFLNIYTLYKHDFESPSA